MRFAPGGARGSGPSNGSPEAWASRCLTVDPGGPAASSSSTIPSSAATSTATAEASFVTDAQANGRSSSPYAASVRPVTATATWVQGHPSTCRRASISSTLPRWIVSTSPPALPSRTARLLARRPRRPPGVGLGHGADHAGRRRSAPGHIRPGARVPGDHRPRARRGRRKPRRRRPHPDLRRRGLGDRRGRPCPPGRVRGRPARDDRRRRDVARPALACRNRGRRRSPP